jgi:hypothetical protein
MRAKTTGILLSGFLLLPTSITPAMAIDSERELGNWIGATSNLRYSETWTLFLQGAEAGLNQNRLYDERHQFSLVVLFRLCPSARQ